MTTRRNPLLEKLDPAAEAMMRSRIGGAMVTQAIYVAAKLGIADQLTLGACKAEDLAQRVQADAGTLKRVLRFLVANGVFVEHEDGRFGLNRAAESLQSGHPRSLRPSAIRAGEGMWNVAARLLDVVQTGRTPNGATFFDGVAATTFASRMGGSIAGLGEAIAQLDCVKRARTIVDVGGGHGALLAAVLRTHPQLRGVLFDRAATIDAAHSFLEEAGVRDRCELVAGDFFEAVPKGGDVYVLSWILHDWDDARAKQILRACREAAPNATLLIVEVLLPPHAVASEGPQAGLLADPYTLDLQMLLLTGGRERSAEEFRELLREAGYDAEKTTTLASERGASVIEAYVSSA